jgi:membrane protein required for colicin V production
MHWLDIALLVVLGIGAILGARSGLLWQVARLVTLGAALYLCIYGHELVTSLLAPFLDSTSTLLAPGLAYVLTFLAVFLTGHGITLLLQHVLRASKLKTLDRLLGGALGLVKATLLAGVVLLMMAFFANPQTDAALAKSWLAPVLLQGMRLAAVTVPPEYKEQLNSAIERVKKAGLDKASELSNAAARKAIEDQFRLSPTDPAKDAPPAP